MEQPVIVVQEYDVTVIETPASKGQRGEPGISGAEFSISGDSGNSAVLGTDSGIYVPNDIQTDLLAYYILAKG